MKQAFAIVRKYPNVTMFIWFIFRDEPVSLWHSGLLDESAAGSPATRRSPPLRSRSTSAARS